MVGTLLKTNVDMITISKCSTYHSCGIKLTTVAIAGNEQFKRGIKSEHTYFCMYQRVVTVRMMAKYYAYMHTK